MVVCFILRTPQEANNLDDDQPYHGYCHRASLDNGGQDNAFGTHAKTWLRMGRVRIGRVPHPIQQRMGDTLNPSRLRHELSQKWYMVLPNCKKILAIGECHSIKNDFTRDIDRQLFNTPSNRKTDQ